MSNPDEPLTYETPSERPPMDATGGEAAEGAPPIPDDATPEEATPAAPPPSE
jgi:hypothetical protein